MKWIEGVWRALGIGFVVRRLLGIRSPSHEAIAWAEGLPSVFDDLPPRESVLERDIGRLRRAIARNERKLDVFANRFIREGWSCCASCAFPEYDVIAAKIGRQEAWLAVLLRRLPRKPGRAEARG